MSPTLAEFRARPRPPSHAAGVTLWVVGLCSSPPTGRPELALETALVYQARTRLMVIHVFAHSMGEALSAPRHAWHEDFVSAYGLESPHSSTAHLSLGSGCDTAARLPCAPRARELRLCCACQASCQHAPLRCTCIAATPPGIPVFVRLQRGAALGFQGALDTGVPMEEVCCYPYRLCGHAHTDVLASSSLALACNA